MPGSEYINLDKLLLGFGSSSITCAIHFYTNIFTSLLFNFNFLLFFFNLFFYSRAEIEIYFFNFQSQPLMLLLHLISIPASIILVGMSVTSVNI